MPFVAMSPEGFLDSFTYHSERGLQIESSYASLLLLGDSWGLTPQEPIFNHGAMHLDSSLADFLATASPVITLVVLFGIYWTFWRRQQSGGLINNVQSNLQIMNYAVITIIAFLLGNKVFSPQYIIWLCPLIPLITVNRRAIVWILFIIVGLSTHYIYSYNIDYIFPDNYSDLVRAEAPEIYVLLIRNLLLLIMAYSVLRWTTSDFNSEDPTK
jgi:hypothetical protein